MDRKKRIELEKALKKAQEKSAKSLAESKKPAKPVKAEKWEDVYAQIDRFFRA